LPSSLAAKVVAPILALAMIAVAATLMADSLTRFRLVLDDFDYLAQSRSRARLLATLWAPHNAHIVPLFRLWTHALAAVAGTLANVPTVFAFASFGALALTMLAGGHLVARETGRPALGVAATAALGITTVMQVAATWYSAGQALWAGIGILAMLIALQAWRASGGAWRLALAALAAIAAPAFWSGGYAAGPVGAAYLWADGRPHCRKAAAVPMLAAGLYAAIMLALFGGRMLAPENFHGRSAVGAANPWHGLVYTGQALPEVLVLGNLGLDTAVTAVQGAVFCAALAAAWLATARPSFRPSPLETAGAVLAVVSFALVYTFRGYYSWDNLRSYGWYHALPQIGAVLFAAGWWARVKGPATGAGRVRMLGDWVGAVALALALFLIHQPRAGRLFDGGAPRMAPSEEKIFLTPELRHARALDLVEVETQRQRRALARLDGAEQLALRQGFGRLALRRALGRVVPPGWPDQIQGLDGLDLLDLPDHGTRGDPEAIRSPRLAELLAPEPEVRPEWLRPGDPWPPKP
jgi:hypothetical protein